MSISLAAVLPPVSYQIDQLKKLDQPQPSAVVPPQKTQQSVEDGGGIAGGKSFEQMTVPEKLAFQKNLIDLIQSGALNAGSLQALYDAIGAQLGKTAAGPVAAIGTGTPAAGAANQVLFEKSLNQVRSVVRHV